MEKLSIALYTMLAALGLVASLPSYAQEGVDLLADMENNYLQIRQKAGTDSVLANFFAGAGIEEDTIYAFMYRPGNCPRCEAGFKTFCDLLHKKGKKFTLISVFDDASVSNYYNKMKGYAADYYLNDTAGVCLRAFSFNNIPLDGSNVLKVTRQGRLVTGGDYTVLGERFVEQLIDRRKPLAYHTYNATATEDGNSAHPCIMADDTLRLVAFGLLQTDSIPLCKISRAPMWKGSTLICPDDVLNAVFVFREDGEGGDMKLAELLDVQGSYKDGFISVDEKQRACYEQAGMLFYILCNATICDNGDIAMSASLPKIQYMDADRREVGVFNQPCIIRHSLSRAYNDTVVPLDFNLFGDDYFYKHFQISVSGCHAIMGCQQLTWPMEYEPKDYRGISSKDPFMATYYDNTHPIMASFNACSGKLEHRFGCLDASAAETRTGYYYVSQLSCANNREVAYTDGYSGRVYICDSADVCRPKAVYSAFTLDSVDALLPDTSLFYTFEYAGKFNNYYYRNIVDVQFNDSSILCLVSVGPVGRKADGKFLVHIDRHTMRRTTSLVPTGSNDICMGLKVDGSSIRLFKIVRDAGRYKVLVSA